MWWSQNDVNIVVFHSLQRNDFLQLLIDAGTEEEEENVEHHDQSMPKRRPLTDAEIVVYCITFLLAGYETTANALAFTAYLLATNPNVQDKLCSEIDLYFQEHPVSGRQPSNAWASKPVCA